MEDREIIDNIETYGVFKGSGEDRYKLLTEEMGFKVGEKADYVLLTGCQLPATIPEALRALKEILSYLQVNYTLLAKEYCCGYFPLVTPALKSRDTERLDSIMELAHSWVFRNIKQAEALGAKSIVTFCTGCDIIYSRFRPQINQEVIFYTELINRYFNGGKLNLKADYYAGCYRGRQKLDVEPINLESSLSVLSKIDGLELNHLDNRLCCVRPNELNELDASLKTNTMINICTGCHLTMKRSSIHKDTTKFLMLPDIVWASLQT